MSTETNINARFYPNLSSVIDLDHLPEVFDDLNATDKLKTLLEKIFFRDLQYSKSDTNDAAFYSLSLIARERLALDIPGLDIGFVLNPDLTGGDATVSVFPITFEYEWKILGLVRDFDTSWFDFSTPDNENIAALFQFALRALNLSEEQVMANFVNSFYDPTNSSLSPIEQFVDALNNSSFLSAEIDDSVDYTLKDLTVMIYDLTGSQFSSIIACNVYLLSDPDVAVNLQNVKSFFRSFLPQDLETYLKDMLIPKFSCSLQLSAGIEFPRSILKPVYLFDGSNPYDSSDGFTPTNDPEEAHSRAFQLVPPINGVEQKALIKAAQWDVNFSTESGFGSDLEVVLSTAQPYQIGNTNVILNVESLSIPFRIQGDTQPAHFYGKVYIRTEEEGEEDDIIDVRFDVFENGFELDVESVNGVELAEIDKENIKVNVILKKLGIKKEDSDYDFSIGGKITTDIDIPKIGKVFPALIDVKDVTIKTNDEPNTYNIELTWPGGAKITMSDSEPFSGYIPWGAVGDGGLITLDGINFTATDTDSNGILFESQFKNLGIDLKMITGSIDGMGIDMLVSKPDDPDMANLGGLLVDLGFNPPVGIGIGNKELSKEAQDRGDIFEIFGYLHLDRPNNRYWGALVIKVNTGKKPINISAIGVYTDKLPNGEEGNSFLGLVNWILPKEIPLFWGLMLKGVGGIVGTNRGLNSEAIIRKVKDQSIEDILFPDIQPETVASILAELEQVFPLIPGRNTFGLIFKITYPPVVEIDLGLMISLPNPLVFALVGMVKAEQAGKLDLKAAFAVIVDFGNELISIDASVLDSTIGSVEIEGEMAARMGWGDNKQFLISVGGFHPNYATDEFTLPELKRVVLRIRDEEGLKAVGQSYIAVTSNAVMFGARVDFLVHSEKFEKLRVEAYAGIDALFLFNPFKFEVAVYAGAVLFWNGKQVLNAFLDVFVKGPGSWHLKGYAEVEVFKLKVKAEFDKKFGNAEDDSLPAVNVLDILQVELDKANSWSTPDSTNDSVEIKERPAESEGLLAGPNSTLRFDQMAIPLNTTVEKLSENPVLFPVSLTVSSVQLGIDVDGTLVYENQSKVKKEDYFAPANYKKLSDKEKLESKSFEIMESGVDIVSADWLLSNHFVEHANVYEVMEATEEGEENSGVIGTIIHDRSSVINNPLGGQLGKNSNFKLTKRKLRRPKVKLTKPEYVIVDKLSNEVVFRSKSKTLMQEELKTHESASVRSFRNTSAYTNINTTVK